MSKSRRTYLSFSDQLEKMNGAQLALTGLAGFAMFAAATAIGIVLTKESSEKLSFPSEAERRTTFDTISSRYDSMINGDEKSLGIVKMRQEMMARAKGVVLEVAAGTGRNFEYYDSSKVSNLWVTDFSRKMLQVALKKKESLDPIPVKFKVLNAVKTDFPDESFDTVVDTFGICSFEDPHATLVELRRILKKDGEALFIEHGSSRWGFLSRFLDRNVKDQLHKYGCYHNRDILSLIEDAGFETKEIKRKHFGTTYSIVASPTGTVRQKLVSVTATTQFGESHEHTDTPEHAKTCTHVDEDDVAVDVNSKVIDSSAFVNDKTNKQKSNKKKDKKPTFVDMDEDDDNTEEEGLAQTEQVLIAKPSTTIKSQSDRLFD